MAGVLPWRENVNTVMPASAGGWNERSMVGGFIAGNPPRVDDPDKKIVKFFIDNRDAIRIGTYVFGLASVAFLWFLGSLFGRLRRAEGGSGRLSGVALTGGVVTVAINLVATVIYGFGGLHPETAAGDFKLSSVLFGGLAFTAAVFTAGVAVVLWSKSVLPKWFGYLGEAIALGWFVSAASVSTENRTIAVIGFIVFFAWAVWVFLLSVMLYRTPEKA